MSKIKREADLLGEVFIFGIIVILETRYSFAITGII
jgi:hypothetical protein